VEELRGSAAVVVAVPIDELASVARQLLPRLPDECLVLHASSLQRREALGLTEPEFRRILGTHPIAGSERSGFSAADRGMFRGATVRAEARATDAERARIETLWRRVGVARVVWGDAVAHDELMAWVSHLPQLTATALAAVLAQRGIASDTVGPGARDATRLAASDLHIWTPILQRAPRETIEALRRLTRTLDDVREALEARDAKSLVTIWDKARAWKTGAEERA
jgi:prephenate dehydrogenase